MDSINTSHPATGRNTSHAPRPDKGNPAAEIGWFLRRERERYNCSLEDAALATRINRRYLAAIEGGELDALPDADDGLRYVSTYASFLGFEPAPLAQHYATVIRQHRIGSPAERALKGSKSAKIIPFPRLGSLGPNAVAILVAGFMVTGVFGAAAWVVVPGLKGDDASIPIVRVEDGAVTAGDPMVTASIPAANEALSRMGTAADALTERDASDIAPASLDDDSSAELGGLTEFIQQNVSGTVASEPAAKPQAKVEQENRVFGAENNSSRLVLEANAPVWVRIEDRQGNVVLTKTMMAGDAYRVPDRKDLVVIARDGGALNYIVDGAKKGTLGAPGEILVGRPLDLASLEAKKS